MFKLSAIDIFKHFTKKSGYIKEIVVKNKVELTLQFFVLISIMQLKYCFITIRVYQYLYFLCI